MSNEIKNLKPTSGIAVFASGSGSNAQRIAEYFAGSGLLHITAVYCNNENAFVLERARNLGIPSVLFNRDMFYNSSAIADDLLTRGTEWIVLAGFLWLIPESILRAFQGRIINIHPASTSCIRWTWNVWHEGTPGCYRCRRKGKRNNHSLRK